MDICTEITDVREVGFHPPEIYFFAIIFRKKSNFQPFVIV